MLDSTIIKPLAIENWSMIYFNLDESIKIAKRFKADNVRYSVSSVLYLPVLINCIFNSSKQNSLESSIPIGVCAKILMGQSDVNNCKRINDCLKLLTKLVSSDSNKKLLNIKFRKNKSPILEINEEFFSYTNELRAQKKDALVVIHNKFFQTIEKLYDSPRVFLYTLEIIYRMQNALKLEKIDYANIGIFKDKMEYLEVIFPPTKKHSLSEFRDKDRIKLWEKFGSRYCQIIYEIAFQSLKISEKIHKKK